MVLGEEEYEVLCAILSLFFWQTTMLSLQVEKILEKRTQKGGYTEYLVKWRNYEVKMVNDPLNRLFYF